MEKTTPTPSATKMSTHSLLVTASTAMHHVVASSIPGFVFMGYLAALFFLPSLAISRGVSSSSAAFLLSVVGISDMMGRITSGLIFDLEKVSKYSETLILVWVLPSRCLGSYVASYQTIIR